MIAALLATLQLAVTTPAVLSVRGAAGDTIIPLLGTNLGAAVALQQLTPIIPLTVQRDSADWWAVRVGAARVELANQLPFARVGDSVVTLASAPFVSAGRLIVPFQVVAELLPRLAPRVLRYVPALGELRVLGGAPPPPSPSDPTPALRAAAASEPHRRRIVVVDAGHGGPDNGMTGPIGARVKVREKDITLAVAKKLAAALRDRGIGVVMTRTTDTLIALGDRGRIANERHGDVFISVHVNAANPNWKDPGAARGFETYFLAEAKTEDARRVERMENESVRFETGAQAGRDDPLNFIINDMAQNEHLRESSELAAGIQERLATVEPGPDRGVKQAGFVVLVRAYMPAVLVEIGFGTNASEARFLTNGAHQTQLARAIAGATVAYLDRYEKRLQGATP